MRSPNKTRGEVALPEAFGKGLFIRFTIDAMERLEAEFGEDFVEAIIDGTGKSRASVFRKVFENTIVDNAEFDIEALQANMDEARNVILDALFLTIHGRTVDEQLAKEEADRIAGIAKNLEKMGQDPQMAPALAFLQSFGGLGTEPASDQTKSGASPQEK